MGQYYCKTCCRTMDESQFYISHRIDKYPPDGHFGECKKCLTRHVNNWEPRSFMWILQEADVPFIEEEWNKLLEKFAQDRSKVSGTTILGRYLSKMKLAQYKQYRWADTEKLKAQATEEKEEAMVRQGFSEEEIADVLNSQFDTSLPVNSYEIGNMKIPDDDTTEDENSAIPAPIDNLTPDYFDDDLTDEDRKYLTIKWGKTYKPYEWVQLEQYYSDMMNAFDIQTPAHIDYLKLICKTSLKCHQLLDIGDIEGFQRMSRTYDMLMKSAKFTAAQNKDLTGEGYSAIDELVRLAEEEGFIPRYYVDQPNDKVDATIKDMRDYVNTLVRNEMGLGNLIENAVRQMSKESSKEEDADEIEDIIDTEQLENEMLSDEDFEDHYKFLEMQKEADVKMFTDKEDE